MIEVGQKAPGFSLLSDTLTGEKVTLQDLKGEKVVLFFYPKDNTPGCTREACDFRDLTEEFKKAGARIFGISRDSVKSHDAFKKAYNLSFPLLSDESLETLKAYGAWGEKTLYGKKSFGVIRSTVVIDEQGIIRKIWRSVKVDGHAAAVLEFIRKLSATDGGSL